jgi:hypothetical protein
VFAAVDLPALHGHHHINKLGSVVSAQQDFGHAHARLSNQQNASINQSPNQEITKSGITRSLGGHTI